MFKKTLALAMLSVVAVSAHATSYLMNFDTDSSNNAISSGTTIASQYAGWGFQWTPNAFVGTGWATNTDMTATSTSTGFGYSAGYGNVLHSFDGWFNENDDPSMLLTSANLMSSITATFIGDSDGQSVLALYDAGGSLINFTQAVGGMETGETLTVTAPLNNAKYAVVLTGWFLDWAAVDNVRVEAVPEPGSLVALGLGAVALMRRRKSA